MYEKGPASFDGDPFVLVRLVATGPPFFLDLREDIDQCIVACVLDHVV